jgi:hypothetical protein
MDSPPAGGKNLRTQIWGGKDRGMQPEAKVKRIFFLIWFSAFKDLAT